MIATAGCFVLLVVLFIFFQLSLSSGVSSMRTIAVQGF
jgi:cell division septal protein FtsQ